MNLGDRESGDRERSASQSPDSEFLRSLTRITTESSKASRDNPLKIVCGRLIILFIAGERLINVG
jgi:hypothetical protein